MKNIFNYWWEVFLLSVVVWSVITVPLLFIYICFMEFPLTILYLLFLFIFSIIGVMDDI